MVEAAWPSGTSFWVASKPHPTHCYLITQTADKSLHLQDPSHAPCKTANLDIVPQGPFWAVCLPDGQLRIAVLMGDSICWHAISLTPDSMVASHWAIRNHGPWLLAGSRLSLIHHPGSGKVLSFINGSMLAITAADTLQEIFRWQISPRHPHHLKEGSCRLTDLAWSHSGTMLAVWLRGPRYLTPAEADGGWQTGPPSVSEVHVYDTSMGQCLQSIDVAACSVKLCWSPGTDVLAVYSRQEDWGEEPSQHLHAQHLTSESDSEEGDCWGSRGHEPGRYHATRLVSSSDLSDGLGGDADDNGSENEDNADEASNYQRYKRPNPFWAGDSPSDCVDSSNDDSLTGVEMLTADIRLLRPLQGQVRLLDCHPGGHCQAQWAHCEWSPQGHLLVAQWVSNSAEQAEGFVIIDPATHEQLYETQQPARYISWAENPLPSPQGPCLTAFFSGACESISLSFSMNMGWRVVPCCCLDLNFRPRRRVFLTPDCRTLVGLASSSGHHDPVRHVVSIPQKRSVDLEAPGWPHAGLDIKFAPVPCAWPAVYAYVHPVSESTSFASRRDQQTWATQTCGPPGPPQELSLVDCRRNVVLRTWTAHDLEKQSNDRQLRPSGPQAMARLRLRCAKWSPDGKHLAVICDSCTMVLTIEETEDWD